MQQNWLESNFCCFKTNSKEEPSSGDSIIPLLIKNHLMRLPLLLSVRDSPKLIESKLHS